MSAKEDIARILEQFSDPTQCALQLARSYPAAGTPAARQDWADAMSAALAFAEAVRQRAKPDVAA